MGSVLMIALPKSTQTSTGILSSIRDQRTKRRITRKQLKICETREVTYTYRYTSGH